jgi:hypothetical protein
MPVIIDEVIISVEVSNQASGGTASASSLSPEDRQVLVAECAERVLEILEQKAER